MAKEKARTAPSTSIVEPSAEAPAQQLSGVTVVEQADLAPAQQLSGVTATAERKFFFYGAV